MSSDDFNSSVIGLVIINYQGVPVPVTGALIRATSSSNAFSIPATLSVPSYALTQPITVDSVRSL